MERNGEKARTENPHAVALGRLGGLVRSEAKQRANRGKWPQGRFGSKAARRPSRRFTRRIGTGNRPAAYGSNRWLLPPLANARSSSHVPTASVALARCAGGTTECG